MNKTILALFLLPLSVLAQSLDVCCVSAKVDATSVTTLAQVASSTKCKKGASLDGYSVCAGKPDPNNLCSQLSAKEQCETCGYFWSGSCQTQDPVAIAKEQLKKEEEAKKKSVTPTPKP